MKEDNVTIRYGTKWKRAGGCWKSQESVRECHGNGEAVIEILHLALLSGKLKMNVGDFRIKKKKYGGDSISGMSDCRLLSAFPSHSKKKCGVQAQFMSLLRQDHNPEKNVTKARGRLNDMIWLYCSAWGEACSRKVTLSRWGCGDKLKVGWVGITSPVCLELRWSIRQTRKYMKTTFFFEPQTRQQWNTTQSAPPLSSGTSSPTEQMALPEIYGPLGMDLWLATTFCDDHILRAQRHLGQVIMDAPWTV